MSAFTVHEPPATAATRLDRAESLVFVKDGFSWGAALLGPFYLAFRAQWLGLLAYLVAAVIVTLVMKAVGAETDWISWALLVLNVITGFEANELKRWSLASAGWREIGTVSGAGLDDAERRFFEAWLPEISAAGPGHEGLLMAGHPATDSSHSFGHAGETLRRLAGRLHSKLAPKA